MLKEKNIACLFRERVRQYSDKPVQASKNADGVFEYVTYEQLYDKVLVFASGLMDLGVRRGDNVALISDNRSEWLVTDLALQCLGAVDVPRGCDSMATEIRFIISFSECKYGFFENSRQLEKILEKTEEIPLLKTAVLFDPPSENCLTRAQEAGIKVLHFPQLLESGKKAGIPAAVIEAEMDKTGLQDTATIIFTSGTTGVPKGVMLTHENYLSQCAIVHEVLPVKPGDMWLSVLPVWHSFERVIQYFAIEFGSGIAYSKPVAAVMLPDFAAIKPQWMCGVPRLWDSLAQAIFRSMKKEGGVKLALFNFFVSVGKKYAWASEHVTGRVCRFHKRSRFLDALAGLIPFIALSPLYAIGNALVFKKIKAKMGGRMVAAISGGGALQSDVDAFYRAIGFKLLEGYGITEAGPVLSVREVDRARPGCVGLVFPCSQIKIVAEEHGKILSNEPLPPGKKGLILARGAPGYNQIMKGYYKRPDLTAVAIDSEGWLNTGDLGMLTWDNEIKITGRAKDTIVLLGGENIEPLVVENGMSGSDYIETAVLLGQDKKYLAALIVPSKEAVLAFAKDNNIAYDQYDALLEAPEIINLIKSEIDSRISAQNGFRTCERVFKFSLLPESFTVGKELSGKQEIMRHKIAELYKKQIESLFD